MKKTTVEDIFKSKGKRKVTMLTCYDYTFAATLDESELDILLVGDSLANVVLGMDETRKVSMLEMINHTRAVALGSRRKLVVSDMPAVAYQNKNSNVVANAKKFMAAGADAVKVEWFKDCSKVVKKLVKAKIPVMGHIGLTPATAHLLGGYKVQGKTPESARELLEQAKLLKELGVFSLVLECVPTQLAKKITQAIKVPTIGIGAGKYCDGQVLVIYDLLGLYKRVRPRFVKVYKDISSQVIKATNQFVEEVKKNKFPTEKQSF